MSDDTTEKAKALRAKVMNGMVPFIECDYDCTYDNEEARALVVLLLSMLSHEKLVELEEYLTEESSLPRGGDRRTFGPTYMTVPRPVWCQGLKCGDFTMRPGGLLDSMPEGWKLTND